MALELPPLNAVQAFEAAARHLSFTRAAEELFVTHGAVSRQVKKLEEHLGVLLFKRLPRSLALTEQGAVYFPIVQEALRRLSDGTRLMLKPALQNTLTVSVIPSFAARWLVPRLERFYQRYPDWDVLLNASFQLADFERENIDMAIRYGGGKWPGLHSVLLMTLDFVPVCAPAIMEGPHPLLKPDDLRHHTLLHNLSRDDWKSWFWLAGVEDIDPGRGPTFNDHNITLQAAIDGLGVALAREQLIDADLKAGRLVIPFELRMPIKASYYIVCPQATVNQPKIKAFREWLLEEAGSTRAAGG